MNHGIDLTSSAQNSGGKDIITRDSATFTANGYCDWDVRFDLMPAINDEHPTDSNFKVSQVETERIPGNICYFTITYDSAFGSSEYVPTPATTYSENTGYEEVDIRFHPNFGTWKEAGEWDDEKGEFKLTSPRKYVTKYIAPTVTVTKTQYFTYKPSSGHASVGKCEAPASEYGSTYNWLIIGCIRAKDGNFWTKQTVYKYSEVEFQHGTSGIYTSA